MLSRTLIPVLMSLASLSSLGQSKDTLRKYFDEQLQFTNKRNAIYRGYAVQDNHHWKMYAFYPDSNLVMLVTYKDARLSIRDGDYIIYFPKTVKSLEGHFTNNEMDGCWQSWYPSGRKKDSGYFYQNHYVGTWMHWYDNGNPKLMQSFTSKENASKVSDPATTKIEGEIEGTTNSLPDAMKVRRGIEGTLEGPVRWNRPVLTAKTRWRVNGIGTAKTAHLVPKKNMTTANWWIFPVTMKKVNTQVPPVVLPKALCSSIHFFPRLNSFNLNCRKQTGKKSTTKGMYWFSLK